MMKGRRNKHIDYAGRLKSALYKSFDGEERIVNWEGMPKPTNNTSTFVDSGEEIVEIGIHKGKHFLNILTPDDINPENLRLVPWGEYWGNTQEYPHLNNEHNTYLDELDFWENN